MKIWKIEEPLQTSYAQCWLRSPPLLKSSPCKACDFGNTYEKPSPLAFEWEVGSNKIGDFVWPGGGRTAVVERVIEVLSERVPYVKAGAIEMVQDSRLKRPKNPLRGKPRVWLPYSGPPLMELVVGHQAPILPETTTVVMDRCATCGRENRHLTGVEIKQHRWSQEIEDLVPRYVPRTPGQGVFVSKSDVGHGIFRANMIVPGILCTDEVKAVIEGAKLTNIDFLEYGDVV